MQVIMFNAARKAAKLCDPTVDDAFILAVVMGEALAAISTELMAQGSTLREPGGVEKVVRATVGPIEKMLRQNIADYLAKEQKATRQ